MPAPKFTLPVTGTAPKVTTREGLEVGIDAVSQALFDQIGAIATGLQPAGNWDASAGTFPSGAALGTYYVVNVAGTVSGQAFAIGDWLIPLRSSPSTTVYALNWFRADYSKIVPAGLPRKSYTSVADMQADATVGYSGTALVVSAGDTLEAQGFRYEVAASGATDHHLTTAGGVKLLVLPKDGIYSLDAFAAFSGTLTGTRDNAAIASAITAAQGKALIVGAGPYDFGAYPANMDNVFIAGSPRTAFTNLRLPLSSGVFTGNKEIAIISATCRYYNPGPGGAAAGWYLIYTGANDHDPILTGPVSLSGSSSFILDITLDEFGLASTEWTPSGVVCGPDETLAQSGVTFGATVGTTSMQIYGSHNANQAAYINWSGASWTGAGSTAYDFLWVDAGADHYLEVSRKSTFRRAAWDGNDFMLAMPRESSGQPFLHVSGEYDGTSAKMRFRFRDSTFALKTAPDTNIRFYMMDPGRLPQQFKFNTDPGTNANIWIVGTFVRKGSVY